MVLKKHCSVLNTLILPYTKTRCQMMSPGGQTLMDGGMDGNKLRYTDLQIPNVLISVYNPTQTCFSTVFTEAFPDPWLKLLRHFDFINKSRTKT